MTTGKNIKEQKESELLNYLVLMDFSEASYKALKYIISMAKLLGGKIHVFHIGNANKMVTSDNQVVALRDLRLETRKIEKKLKSILEIIAAEDIQATCNYTIGNIISELKIKIAGIKPDLVIIGKSNKRFGLSGKLTSYLVNNYSGSILIVQKEVEFKVHSKILIRCEGKVLKRFDTSLVFEIAKYATNPPTILTDRKLSDSQNKIDLLTSHQSSNLKVNEVLFESHKKPTVHALSEYVADKNIELLCIGREKQITLLQSLFLSQNPVLLELVKDVQIPLLLMGFNSNSNGRINNR